MEMQARQASFVTHRSLPPRGKFGIVRTKRKLLRETPTRLRRNGSEAPSIPDTFTSINTSQKVLLPPIKPEFGHERSGSMPRLVLRHFPADTSMLDEESGDGTPAVEKERDRVVEQFPPEKDLIQELIQKYSGSGEFDFLEIANRAKSVKSVEAFWEKRTGLGFNPSSRTGATLTMINRKAYLFGGECRSRFNDIKVLNTDIWKWEWPGSPQEGDPPPEPRVQHSAVCFRNSLVVFGGSGEYNPMLKLRNCFNRVHLYDTVSNRWRTAETVGQPPAVRRNHACTLVGNTMLVYGGMDEIGNALDDLHALNLETLRWFVPRLHKSSGPKPGKRHSMSMVPAYQLSVLRQFHFDLFHIPSAYDENFTKTSSGIYLFGGANQAGTATNDLFVLKPKPIDVKDDDYYLKWSKPSISGTPPEPRYAYSATLKSKFIVFFGGRNDAVGRSTITVQGLALLNLESMRWETVVTYGVQPAGRWGAAVAASGSQVIIFGGLRLEEYCSGKLVLLELDPQMVQEKKEEFAYIKSLQQATGSKAFRALANTHLVQPRSHHSQHMLQQRSAN